MFCPKCLKALKKVVIKLSKKHHASHGSSTTLRVDQCPACNGVWFEGNELERYLEYNLGILNTPIVDPEQYMEMDETVGNCPHCDIKMEKEPAKNNPDITIDKCRQCGGVWLDTSEIEQLSGHDESMAARFLDLLRSLFRSE